MRPTHAGSRPRIACLGRTTSSQCRQSSPRGWWRLRSAGSASLACRCRTARRGPRGRQTRLADRPGNSGHIAVPLRLPCRSELSVKLGSGVRHGGAGGGWTAIGSAMRVGVAVQESWQGTRGGGGPARYISHGDACNGCSLCSLCSQPVRRGCWKSGFMLCRRCRRRSSAAGLSLPRSTRSSNRGPVAHVVARRRLLSSAQPRCIESAHHRRQIRGSRRGQPCMRLCVAARPSAFRSAAPGSFGRHLT
jgi:hypothetical protein